MFWDVLGLGAAGVGAGAGAGAAVGAGAGSFDGPDGPGVAESDGGG